MPKAPALEYEARTPAFLQRLKANHVAQDGRHNVQIPRARGRSDRLKMDGDDGDDDPVILDEDGNVVTKDALEMDRSASTEKPEQVSVDGKTESAKAEGLRERTRKAEASVGIGSGARKRKAGLGKVIAADEESGDEQEGTHEREIEDERPVKALSDATKAFDEAVQEGKEVAKKEGAKKGKRKKVKLSFEEPE